MQHVEEPPGFDGSACQDVYPWGGSCNMQLQHDRGNVQPAFCTTPDEVHDFIDYAVANLSRPGHNSWDPAYSDVADNDIYSWMLGFTEPEARGQAASAPSGGSRPLRRGRARRAVQAARRLVSQVERPGYRLEALADGRLGAVGLPGITVAAAARWEAVEAMRAVIATVLEVAPDAFDVGGVAPWSARTGWPLEAGSRVRDRSRGGDIVWEARIL